MNSYKINFTVDGKCITPDEIRTVEKSCYQVVFDGLLKKGIKLEWNDRTYTREDLKKVSLADAREILGVTRERIGREGMLALYKEELKCGDEMWKDIAAHSRTKENLQAGIVEVETIGITLEQFMLFNQSLAKANNLYLPSKMHPEHYSFEAGPGGTQTIIETFGMYKYPTYLHLEPPAKGDTYKPITPDQDTIMSMVGYTKLMSDGSDTKLVGMHQFKQCKNGIKVKLGVFLPEAAPKEMLEGHKWHLMVEFLNGLEEAAKIKPNFLQKAVLSLALKKMKNSDKNYTH